MSATFSCKLGDNEQQFQNFIDNKFKQKSKSKKSLVFIRYILSKITNKFF